MSLYDYKYFMSSRRFQGSKDRLEELVDIVKTYNPTSVLDVGCGIGNLVLKLRELGIKAVGVDSAEDLKLFWKSDGFYISDASKLPFEDKSFDLVISTDFFEHIPEEKIDSVKSEMLRVGKKVIARVAYQRKLTRRQSQYHVTNKPKDWWEDKLEGIELV